MRIGVIGCGSLGGVLAAKLWAVYGDSVCTFARTPDTVVALRKTGLTIDDGRKGFTAFPRVFRGPGEIDAPLDLIILATKTTALEQVAEEYLSALSDSGRFLTVQNGLIALNLVERCGDDRVVPGCVMWGAGMSNLQTPQRKRVYGR